ncbi:MAG: MFS transporter, partial [Candidatus Bathyarchaeia archaeon]
MALEYGLTNFDMGIILAIFNVSSSLLQTLFGILSRRISRKKLLCLGFVINSGAFATISLSQSVFSLTTLLFIAGIGWSTYHPLGIHFLSDLYQEKRGQAMGYHQAGGSVGSFLAPPIIGLLTENHGWRYSFLMFSSIGFILAGLLWIFLEEVTLKPAPSSRENIRDLIDPLTLILSGAIYSITLRGVQSFATKYFQEAKGTTYLEATVLYSSLQVAGIVSGPLSGLLSDLIGRIKVIGILVVVQSVSVLGLRFFNGIPLYLLCVINGFAWFGLLATSDAFIVDITSPRLVGAAIGINLATSFAMSVIVPPIL